MELPTQVSCLAMHNSIISSKIIIVLVVLSSPKSQAASRTTWIHLSGILKFAFCAS